MTRQHKDWTPTVEQCIQLHDGLAILQEARVALQSVQSPQWQEWRQAQEKGLEGLQQSFDYFLSGKAIPASYVFVAWVDAPAIHLRWMRRILHEYCGVTPQAD